MAPLPLLLALLGQISPVLRRSSRSIIQASMTAVGPGGAPRRPAQCARPAEFASGGGLNSGRRRRKISELPKGTPGWSGP